MGITELDGIVYIICSNAVYAYSSQTLLSQNRKPITGTGSLSDIAASVVNKRLYVADNGVNTLWRVNVTYNGYFVGKFASCCYGAVTYQPHKLSVAADGRIFVCTDGGNQLFIYNPDSTMLRTVDMSAFSVFNTR